MSVSVIIPTYNGKHKIGNVLAALALQTTTDFEVIVVIDGSTDGTADMLQALPRQPFELRIVEQPNGGRAQVRNRGAAAAAGDLLIFFDDDMRPAAGTVQMHKDHHAAFPGSILTGGAIDEVTGDMPDFMRFKAMLARKWARDFGDPQTPLTQDTVFLAAANCSMSKATFSALGGFDERLTDAEDYDLGVRAQKAHIDLYTNPAVAAWHDDPVTCSSYIRRLRQYAIAQQKLAAIKPELYGSRTKYGVAPPGGLKGSLFSALCSRSLIRSIDANRWGWLPEAVRYRLYDYVITANGSFYPEKVSL